MRLNTTTLTTFTLLAAATVNRDARSAAAPRESRVEVCVRRELAAIGAGRTPEARGEPDAGATWRDLRPMLTLSKATPKPRAVGISPGELQRMHDCPPELSYAEIDLIEGLMQSETSGGASHTAGPQGPASDPAPWLRLAIVRCPAPGVRPLALDIALPGRDRTRLEVIDVAGRRAYARDLDGLGPGIHRVSLEEAALASGVYWARLAQRDGQSVAKFVVVH
jgi:hypothetical protein